MSTFIIGIDPGLEGAIAVLDFDGELHDVCDMPTHRTGTRANGKSKNQVDEAALVELFTNWSRDDDLVCGIERVQSAPGGGATSMFTFGEGFGLVKGVLAGMRIPCKPITPAKWKLHFGIGRDKGKSIALARATWPESTDQFRLKMHADRAEAALIGLYAATYVFKSEASK